MRLATALQERVDLKDKIRYIRGRIEDNALVQEGEKSNEDPMELLAEHDECCARLGKLMFAINYTNCHTMIDGKSLTQIIAEKDAFSMQASSYSQVIDAASRNTYRARQTEIKILSNVNVSELVKEHDKISKKIRELDNILQEANWTTELIEP